MHYATATWVPFVGLREAIDWPSAGRLHEIRAADLQLGHSPLLHNVRVGPVLDDLVEGCLYSLGELQVFFRERGPVRNVGVELVDEGQLAPRVVCCVPRGL